MEQELRERVTRGVALLEEKVGSDWSDQVDHPERFDIGSDSDCVLAQIFGDYESGMECLGISVVDVEYGFTLGYKERDHFGLLNSLWVETIWPNDHETCSACGEKHHKSIDWYREEDFSVICPNC